MSPAWGTLRFPSVFVFLLKLSGSAPHLQAGGEEVLDPCGQGVQMPWQSKGGGGGVNSENFRNFSIGQTPDHLDLAGIASFEGMWLYSTLRPWSAGTVDGFCRSSKAESVRGSAGGSGAVEGLLR